MNLSRVRPAFVVPFVLAATLLAGCGGSDDPSSGDRTTDSSETAGESSGDLVTLEGDGFSIGLPTKATEQTQTVQSQAGPIEVTFYSSEADEGSFVVALTTLPANVEPNLDGAVDGAVSQVDGTLKESSDTTLLGHPAREARFVTSSGGQDATIFARVVAVEDRLFQVQFVVEGEDVQEAPAVLDDVLASIRLD